MGRASRRLVIIFFFSLFLPLNGQSTDDLFIGAMIRIDPSTPIAGEPLLLTISFPLRYSATHQFNSPKNSFPQGISILSGPSFKVISHPIDGEKVEFSYILDIKQVGTFNIDSFELNSNGHTSRSIPFQLIVESPRMVEQINPVTLAWRNPPMSVYEGEAFTLILEAQNLNDLILLDGVTLPPIPNFIVEKNHSFGSINEEKIGETIFFDIPVGSWVLAAQTTGKITIPSIRMRLENSTKVSIPLIINVEATPKVALAYGAVGDFKLTSELNHPNILEQGQIFTLSIKLEGEGNFQLLKTPEPSYKNFELVDRQEREILEPSLGGYKGYREVTYRLKTVEDGYLNIAIPPFTWWNPRESLVERTNPKIYSLKVIGTEEKEETLQFLSINELLQSYDYTINYYLLVLIPLSILLILQLPSKKKEAKTSIKFFSIIPLLSIFSFFNHQPSIPAVIEQAQYNIINAQWHEAIEAYNLAETILKNNIASISYNKALAYSRLGELGSVIYNLRRAIYYDPFNGYYQHVLKLYEYQQEITINAPIKLAPRFTMPLLSVLLLLMAMLALGFKYDRSLRKLFLSLTTLLFFMTGLNFFYESTHAVQEIILTRDELLLRIPDPAASSSIIVKAGSSFIIKGKNDYYYLLSSSMGSDGWIINDNLLLLRGRTTND